MHNPMREAFEVWLKSEGWRNLERYNYDDSYEREELNDMWSAWQAASATAGRDFTDKELHNIKVTVGAMKLQKGHWADWWIKFVDWGNKTLQPPQTEETPL